MAFSLKFFTLQTIKNSLRRPITMSAQLRAEKVVEELKNKNPYFEKYAQKIAKLQETSPEEFLSRVEILDKKAKPDSKAQTANDRTYSELLQPKVKLNNQIEEIPYKKLSDIMKLDLIKDKTVEEIKEIWLEYHKTKDVIAAVIPVEQFELLMQRGKLYPTFIFPLPRSQGFEFIMLQFAANTVHFTPLLCYQVHKENAPECLNIVHYTEFQDKGVILMRGEYDSQVINAREAQCLANQLQLYYCQQNKSKLALLDVFTKTPDNFKHTDIIQEMENLKIG